MPESARKGLSHYTSSGILLENVRASTTQGVYPGLSGRGNMVFLLNKKHYDHILPQSIPFRDYQEHLEEKVAKRTEVLAREIVHRKETMEQLQLAKDAAEAANRAKSEFHAKISHELNSELLVRSRQEKGSTFWFDLDAEIVQEKVVARISRQHQPVIRYNDRRGRLYYQTL